MNYIETCTRLAESRKEPESAIEVGSQWKRNSDGRLCVVAEVGVGVGGTPWLEVRWEGSSELTFTDDLKWFHGRHCTHIVTPKKDLSNVPDGTRLVCAKTGEVVVMGMRTSRWANLRDAEGRLRSVNGLPAYVTYTGRVEWHQRGAAYREEGAAIETPSGGRYYHLGEGELSPEEWAREILTNPECDERAVLPEYQHLIEAAKAEGCYITEHDRETGEQVGEEAFVEFKPKAEQKAAVERHFKPEAAEAEADGGKMMAEEECSGPWQVRTRKGKKYPAVVYRCDVWDKIDVAKFKDRRAAEKACRIFNERYHQSASEETKEATDGE